MFLLGREDLTEREKQDILRSKAEKQLMELLKQKNAAIAALGHGRLRNVRGDYMDIG